MPIASYAGKIFESSSNRIYTFYDFQHNSSLQTEKQDADGTKPSTYIKGSDLETMSFKIKLDVSNGVNPRNEWGDWLRIMASKAAYPFILGNVPFRSASWLLVNVTPGEPVIDNSGKILSIELTLQFEEYVRAGKKSESKGAAKSKAAPGLKAEEKDILLASLNNSANKPSLKRKNPYMTSADLA